MKYIFSALIVALFTTSPLTAQAETYVEFKPGVIRAALENGETVVVDYSADWCVTCRVQQRVVNLLRADNAAYDSKLTFVTVDWDMYARHDVTTDRRIPRRSTLIVLRGDEELGRVVAGTSREQIQALLDTGLAK